MTSIEAPSPNQRGKKKTLEEADASEIPLPPKPVVGVPFKEDMTDIKIGSIR